ncbi:hypothetical protein GCM10023405_03070 [Streptomonospora salina]
MLIVLAAAGSMATAKTLTPANRSHRFADGISVRLLSFDRGRHDGTPYTAWSLEVRNGSDSPVHLAPTTRCWTDLPPRRTGVVPAVDKAGRVAVHLRAGRVTSLRGACAMAADEGRFFYAVRLSQDYDSGISAPIVFHGKLPV